jgi:glucan phosphoethanolaminetransferase (alkaline phosphatase superfamily)
MKRRPATVVLDLCLAAMFGLFAWLQRNDLDPEVYDRPSVLDAALWFGFYLLIAALFVVVLFKPLPRWLLALAAAACLLELAVTGPGLYENLYGNQAFTITQESMSAKDPRVELSREFFGALIALAGVGVLFWQSRRPR